MQSKRLAEKPSRNFDHIVSGRGKKRERRLTFGASGEGSPHKRSSETLDNRFALGGEKPVAERPQQLPVASAGASAFGEELKLEFHKQYEFYLKRYEQLRFDYEREVLTQQTLLILKRVCHSSKCDPEASLPLKYSSAEKQSVEQVPRAKGNDQRVQVTHAERVRGAHLDALDRQEQP